MPLIAPPALQRGIVERLAHLVDAGGAHHAPGLVELQAARVPGQAAILDQPARLALEIADHLLILHLQHRARRQQPAPMGHQLEIAAIGAPELAELRGVGEAAGEIDGEAGDADVQRVAPDMDDAGAGQNQMDEPDVQVVLEQLVGDARGGRRQAAQALDIGVAEGAGFRGVEMRRDSRDSRGRARRRRGRTPPHGPDIPARPRHGPADGSPGSAPPGSCPSAGSRPRRSAAPIASRRCLCRTIPPAGPG